MAIPKQLFFAWFGDEIPDYGLHCINTFKKVNPDYKVDVIHYTTEQISNYKNINDPILARSIEANNKFRLNKFMTKNGITYDNIGYLDFYRRFLINEYGGIYLDTDTFPIKPFDDKVLNLNYFRCGYATSLGFFFGGMKGYLSYNYFKDFNKNEDVIKYESTIFKNRVGTPIDEITIERRLNTKFIELKRKFFNCQIEYGEHFMPEEYYIDHYFKRDWK